MNGRHTVKRGTAVPRRSTVTQPIWIRVISAGAIWFATVAVLLTLPASGRAQTLTGADLDGTVIDQSGAAVPGVTVTVTNVETNIVRTANTDASGRYHVTALPPGTYKMSVELSGFATQNRDRVVLLLGQGLTIDFKLGVAGTREEITVTGESPLVQVSRTEVSSVVNQQMIDNLPINGRNFISFSIITPGVTTDRTPQQGASATSGLSFTGQRARSNNIMVDGLDNNDPVVGAVRATFSQEAIREFQVLTDSYSAEFGNATGGVVNIVTKSGTNEVHGNTFVYFRDKSLNAKNYFDKFDISGNPVNLEKAPFNQKQWGATLGGPAQKNRTFYFLSFERTDAKASNLVTIRPEAAAVLNSLGFPVELGNVPYALVNTEGLGKMDHHWSANHELVVRGSWAKIENENVEPFGGIVAKSRGAEQLRTDWSLSASQTDVLGSQSLNELRVQYAHEDQQINSLDPRCGGPCLLEDQGGPTLEVVGFASVGRQRFTPQPRENARVQIMETLSYFSGGHRMKAGVNFNHIDARKGALPLHFGGRYIFQAIPALGITSGLDGLQKGVPAAYVQGYGNSEYPYPAKDISLFVQDEWKHGRFVLKPGIRYQRQIYPDFNYDISDLNGARLSYVFPDDKNNIAPRVAGAFDLTGDGKTSVHASYGIFYDNNIGAIAGVTGIVTGTQTGVRTLVLPAPRAGIAWSSPGHLLSEAQAKTLLGGSFASLVINADPGLKNPYAHQVAVGVDRAVGNALGVAANFVRVRGFNQPGTIDYNPVLPSILGPGRRPNDVNGLAGTSASVLQYTSFGESWYNGMTVSLNKRLSHNYQFLIAYTLSKAEDTSTDFQSNFIPQNNGRGRDPNNKTGLPLGFDPNTERGPATHDQRHRLVVSGIYQVRGGVQLSAIVSAASGRPFTPLAGLDLNGDGNGGAFPSDRARQTSANESTSVGRNSATTANQYNVDFRVSKILKFGRKAGVEMILDMFNVFNRANFIEDTNQSSFVIFGPGAYPTSPAPDYGKYTLTLPPRQVQLAAKVSF